MRVLARIRSQYFRISDEADEQPFVEVATPGAEVGIASLLVDNQCNGGWHAGVYVVSELRDASRESDSVERWMGNLKIAELSYCRPSLDDVLGFKLVQVRPRNPLPDANDRL